MKKILFVAFALLALFTAACTKHNDQILVRFQNNLGSNIEASRLSFDETHITEIGALPAGAKSDYIPFDYFLVGAELPMGILDGKKDGADFSASAGLWCGTGVEFKQLEPGKYTIEINKIGVDSFVYYQIGFLD